MGAKIPNFGRGEACKMPWVSVCTLIGTFAMAGLPLFNGFISEWLYLSIFFHHYATEQFFLALFSPLMIALSVLVFGLAGFVIVKFYGIAFLGQPRELKLENAYPSTWFEKIGLLWLSFLCIFLGIWSNQAIYFIQIIIHQLSAQLQPAIQTQGIGLHFINHLPSGHGFNPLLLAIGILFLLTFVFLILKRLSPSVIRRAPCWSCGFTKLTSHMQDSAEGFGQPFKQIFSSLITVKLQLPKADDIHPHYHSYLNEKIWSWLYFPLVNFTTRIASLTKWIQQGRITTYLLYIALTLFILLIWVVWL